MLVDTASLVVAFAAVLAINRLRPDFAAGDQLHPARLVIEASLIAGLVGSFRHLGHYEENRPFWQETSEILLAFGLAFLLEAAGLFFLKLDMSRATVVGYWAVGSIVLLCARFTAKSWLRGIGRWSVPAVIVGTGPNARDLAVALVDDPLPAYELQAFVSLAPGADVPAFLRVADDREIRVLSIGDDPFEIVRRFPRSHIFVALELEELARSEKQIEALGRATEGLDLVLPLRGLPTRCSYRTRWIAHDLSAFRLGTRFETRWQGLAKRGFDIAGASVLLLLSAPLFLVLALLVRSEGAPILYRHRRIGRHGKPFDCLKFRTMVPDAERRLQALLAADPAAAEEWRTTRKLRNDPRVTRLGRWLRRTSLDELPQLWNVLKGDMSLVGPRPVTEEEVAWYGRERLVYLQSRPGLTGLWQTSGRSDLDFQRRVRLDVSYAENWSLWRDLVILLNTIRVILARQGAY
jgi:undecaprenyl-phosphate galactose phosphotransferase